MKRVFRTRYFSRWMRKTELTDMSLCKAVSEMEQGLIDADLGSGIVKKRVALPGRGKSGSTRTLVATNKSNRWFFVFGFEKNERDNISDKELEALKDIATDLLKLTSNELDVHIESRAINEITYDYQEKSNKPDLGRGSRNRT